MDEISGTTHDGVLLSLDKFDSVVDSFKLGYLLSGATEQLSRALQGKDTTLQGSYYRCNSSEESLYTTRHRGRVQYILLVMRLLFRG